MGGSSLPTSSTPGYTTWTDCYGRTWTTCVCLGLWLTAAQRLGLARGLIREGLDIVQTTGGNPLSGGTHIQGGAADAKQRSTEWVHLYREMGAAAWPRVDTDGKIDGDPWEGNEHTHLVLDGCEHNNPARYQVTAYWRGYSGLGQASSGTYAGMWGYGSKDPDPWRPSVRRTWREGIAWATAQMEEIIMDLTDENARELLTRPAIMKNTIASTPADVAPSYLIEGAARLAKSADANAKVAAVKAGQAVTAIAALSTKLDTLSTSGPVTDEQLERVLRKVLGSVDGATAPTP